LQYVGVTVLEKDGVLLLDTAVTGTVVVVVVESEVVSTDTRFVTPSPPTNN